MGYSPDHSHYSVPLSRASIEYKAPDLAAEKVLPRIKVDNELDIYYEWDKSAFNIVKDERADGAPENESTGGWFERNYHCLAYGLRDKITRRMRKNSDSILQLDITVNNRLLNQLRTNLEWRVLGPGGVVRTTSNVNYVNSAVGSMSGTNASPRTIIQEAITGIQQSSGMMPNQIVSNPDQWRQLTRTAEYRDEVKHVADIRNMDTPTTLYGLKVIEATAVANLTGAAPVVPAPKTGASAMTLNWIMDDDMFISYSKPSLGMRDLLYGGIFYTETYSRKWWDDESEVDWVAVNDIYVPKVFSIYCGALIQSPFGGNS